MAHGSNDFTFDQWLSNFSLKNSCWDYKTPAPSDPFRWTGDGGASSQAFHNMVGDISFASGFP